MVGPRRSREFMFVPHDFGIALVMMITSAICWGSWANTYKGVKNYRFELFYWDYAAGIFLISLVLAFTMGSTSNDRSEEHTSELQSRLHLVCRLLLEKKKKIKL